MKTLINRFYRFLVATSIVITVTATSTQIHAITQGIHGDALLVPFVLYSGQGGIDINTRIYIKCPERWIDPDGVRTLLEQ